jgi:hypothetical protein
MTAPKVEAALRAPAEVAQAEEIASLRANLRSVTDAYETLLNEGEFPPSGRSQDDKDSTLGWWDRAHERIRAARKILELPEEAPQWKV